MKKYLSLSLKLVMIIPVLVSCSKSMLDKSPHDQLSTNTFWKTESDAELGLTGCYSSLYSSYFSMDNLCSWDGLTDNAWAYNNTANIRSAVTSTILSSTTGIVTDFYASSYSQIRVYNNFLGQIDNVNMPSDQKNEMKGEVHFLRSFFYFYLSEFYGGVPLIIKPYQLGDSLLPRAQKSDVVSQVLSDLDTAINYLPDVPYTDGHVVKGTALLLKAKVLLHNSQFQQAASVANTIISSGIFHLYPQYNALFLYGGQGTDNSEIMFSVKYQSPTFENISGVRFAWWMDVMPLQNLVDDYECLDGLPISQSPLYDSTKPYANRDPRLQESIYVPGSPFNIEGYANWSDRIQFLPPPLKYCQKKYVENITSVDQGLHCQNATVIFRYADALLMYAEAQNEAVGPDASVYNAVNLVRARSSMPPLPAGLSQSGMRDRIRHERRIEFVFEGERLLDLKRWGLAMNKISSVTTSQAPMNYIFQQNNYLWPIPLSETDYYNNHGSQIEQNPGY